MQPPLQRRFVVKVLREASNEGTLRAFRNADRFPTFNRGDRIKFQSLIH